MSESSGSKIIYLPNMQVRRAALEFEFTTKIGAPNHRLYNRSAFVVIA
jgi:hypothetical protein